MQDGATISIRAFGRDDLEWLVAEHGTHYAASDGFDESFPVLVRKVAESFLDRAPGPLDRGWIAARGDERLGSIFCAGEEGQPGIARLRLFYVVARMRGTGLGRRLFDLCLGHAAAAGASRMLVATHESHAAAGRLYARSGFRLVATRPTRSFGVEVVEQHWERALDAPFRPPST